MALIDQFNFRIQSVWKYDPFIENTTKKMADIDTTQMGLEQMIPVSKPLRKSSVRTVHRANNIIRKKTEI
jgi:hypothetical protein